MLFGFAVNASVGKEIVSFFGDRAVVKCFYLYGVTFALNGRDTVSKRFYLCNVEHAVTGNTYGVDLFTVKAMLGKELIETVSVAGFEEDKYFSFALLCFFYEIF